MRFYRYSRWDGTQELDPFTATDLMDFLADRLLDDRDLSSAMREMLQRGAQISPQRRMSGLRDLLERLRQSRQEQLQRYNLGSIMDDITQQLERVVQTERDEIERRLAEAREHGIGDGGQLLENIARRRLTQLDALPPDVGGRVQSLRDYDFMDPDARRQFDELLESLQRQVIENYFEGMKQSLGAVTPEMLADMQQMVRDLNGLLEAHRRGDDSEFEDFLERWGHLFRDGIENVEQLADHLHRQLTQMQSLLDSMTPEMRRDLERLVDQLFRDGDLQRDLARLMANLDRLFPTAPGDELLFSGDEPLSLQEAMRLMGEMRGLDELERELLESVRMNDASRLDSDEVGRLLGEEARRMAEELRDFVRMLEEAGLIRRSGRTWALTPRAMRKIGEHALDEIFGHIDRGLAGEHSLTRWGWGVERLDETKAYRFGDAFALDMHGTLMNALRREGGGTPVRLTPDDFEVYQAASMNQCTTVIMLDMSYSMLHSGRFQAGRKVALALDSLIRTKFPRDALHVVAFSYFVLPLEPHMLLDDHWIDPRGTDFPEAFRQARSILAKRSGGTKQIIMITDGEPHANSGGWGGYVGGWSMRQAMDDTLREVTRCTREGITVNTFMLDAEPVVTTFVRALTKVNNGRIFFADPARLGEYVIVDYVKNRRRAG
ncbi:MAG: VWA domain-containing protein [Chloroflexi bacterium]|nr:VWA domain-containing protein [Chloroflexota bacterium]